LGCCDQERIGDEAVNISAQAMLSVQPPVESKIDFSVITAFITNKSLDALSLGYQPRPL
jgi:phosphate uptake regulator